VSPSVVARRGATTSRLWRSSSSLNVASLHQKIYVRVSRHARHRGLRFLSLRTKEQQNADEPARTRRRRGLGVTVRSAVEGQHQQHVVSEVEAVRQYPGSEACSPGAPKERSRCQVFRVPLPAVAVPSHVFGAMKSRGAPTPADSGREEEVQRKGRAAHTVGSPAAGRIDWAGRGHRCLHRTKGGLRSRLCDPRTRSRLVRQVRTRKTDVPVGEWCF
jgi:hypothetical protein